MIRRTTNQADGVAPKTWHAALDSDPDWVLITSWNEWHEGSEIEPSLEHGDREIVATAGFAQDFRSRPPRERE